MRTSATGKPTTSRQMRAVRGFSLIELLVVLFVIVLATSLVTLNVGGGREDRALREALDRLMALAEYALDEAQASGSDFGVLFVSAIDERGDRRVTAHWRQRLAQGWREPQRSVELFVPVEFPPAVDLQLVLDGIEVLVEGEGAANPASGRAPQWLLLASGETQNGELLLFHERETGEPLGIRWDALARFEFLDDDEGDFPDEFARGF